LLVRSVPGSWLAWYSMSCTVASIVKVASAPRAAPLRPPFTRARRESSAVREQRKIVVGRQRRR
jgi:hypothetical protein